MDRSARFRLNAPSVVQEHFDKEVVIVNLDSGRYYCLQGTGAEIWQLIIAGRAHDDLVSTLANRFEDDGQTIRQELDRLTAQLQDEGLVVPVGEAGSETPPDVVAGAIDGARRRFEPPVLQIYSDMQELLMLDPIHEVDPAAGWPQPRSDGSDRR